MYKDRAKRLAYLRKHAATMYARYKAAGLCVNCGMVPVSKFVWCLACRRKQAVFGRRYKKAIRRVWLALNLCASCGRPRDSVFKWCLRCRVRSRGYNAKCRAGRDG